MHDTDFARLHILIVDDEPNIRRTLRLALEAMGHRTTEAGSASEAKNIAGATPFDLAFVDLRLGQESGLDLLQHFLENPPSPLVVMMTAYASIDGAVDAMRRGAFDYLAKPFTPSQVRAGVQRGLQARSLRNRVSNLEARIRSEIPTEEFAEADPAMRAILDQARRVAETDAPVLIRGENGTGKGVLARTIHRLSRRASGPFVTVNCPSLNANLLESELFGHARGAFTGAIRDTSGKVAAAEGGTLFLDEIADLPLVLQPKLLRFLQERRYERVGEIQTRAADLRLIAATNRDIESAVRIGEFREDLLYRLNVVELTLPPLRQRTDILEIANHLLTFFSRQMGRSLTGFDDPARKLLANYSWPGNVRELRNAVERAAIFAAGPTVGIDDLPDRLRATAKHPESGETLSVEVGRPVTLEALEAEHIRRILTTADSREDAARILGIDPSTLYRKRKCLGI